MSALNIRNAQMVKQTGSGLSSAAKWRQVTALQEACMEGPGVKELLPLLGQWLMLTGNEWHGGSGGCTLARYTV